MTQRATPPNYGRAERLDLCDLLTALGPDQPTLCEGWLTRDLAAHLVLRDRRPLAALGIVIAPLAGHTQRVQQELAGSRFEELVDTLRTPPRWSPRSYPPLEGITDTMEMFIHHEDVRRGQPDWRARSLPAPLRRALWRRVRPLARLRLRRFPGSLTIDAPGYGQVRTGARTGTDGPRVRLSADPGELAMFLTGRQRAARVELTGPEELTDRLRSTGLKL